MSCFSALVHKLFCQFFLFCYRPGTYEHEIPKNRRVQWHQSFGGTPVFLPEITVQSTIGQNTEKVNRWDFT